MKTNMGYYSLAGLLFVDTLWRINSREFFVVPPTWDVNDLVPLGLQLAYLYLVRPYQVPPHTAEQKPIDFFLLQFAGSLPGPTAAGRLPAGTRYLTYVEA